MWWTKFDNIYFPLLTRAKLLKWTRSHPAGSRNPALYTLRPWCCRWKREPSKSRKHLRTEVFNIKFFLRCFEVVQSLCLTKIDGVFWDNFLLIHRHNNFYDENFARTLNEFQPSVLNLTAKQWCKEPLKGTHPFNVTAVKSLLKVTLTQTRAGKHFSHSSCSRKLCLHLSHKATSEEWKRWNCRRKKEKCKYISAISKKAKFSFDYNGKSFLPRITLQYRYKLRW